MPNNKSIVSVEVKQQILERVKKGDVPIAQIASEHGIAPKNIYNWLSRGATSQPTWTDLNKLKKENKELKELIGAMTSHSIQLIMNTLINAVTHRTLPEILHSDQGSEYTSKDYQTMLKQLDIKISMSKRASPWENGYQESFYNQCKVDLGDLNRFETLGEVAAAIYLHIHYYNTSRIHTALRMAPRQYAMLHLLRQPLIGHITS